jgi:hypothetical protein
MKKLFDWCAQSTLIPQLKQISYLGTYDLCGPVRNVLMQADPIRGQVGGGWALDIDTFFGPLKKHRAVRRVPFGAQNLLEINRKLWNAPIH